MRAPLTHCRNGHALTPDNIYPAMAKQGKRECWTCRRASERRRQVRRREAMREMRAQTRGETAKTPPPTIAEVRPSYCLTREELKEEQRAATERRWKKVFEAIARCKRLEKDGELPIWLHRKRKGQGRKDEAA